jgi:hypothetical protein
MADTGRSWWKGWKRFMKAWFVPGRGGCRNLTRNPNPNLSLTSTLALTQVLSGCSTVGWTFRVGPGPPRPLLLLRCWPGVGGELERCACAPDIRQIVQVQVLFATPATPATSNAPEPPTWLMEASLCKGMNVGHLSPTTRILIPQKQQYSRSLHGGSRPLQQPGI